MLGLYGISNTNPHGFSQVLRRQLQDGGHDPTPFKPQLLGFEPWPDVIKGVVLVPTINLLLQRLPLLENANAVVFVFDTALLLEYVPACKVLDVAPKTQSFVYRFIPLPDLVQPILDAKRGRTHVKVSSADIKLIPQLLGQTTDSLLAPILTWLYSVKDTNARQEHMRTLYGWMRGDKDSAWLQQQLPGTKGCAKLMSWVNSDVGVATVTAVRDMVGKKAAGKTVNLDKLAKTHGIAAFDLKYVATTLQKLDATPKGS